MEMTRKQEATIVKRAVVAAGFDKNNVRVTHGHGTAWGWLTVHLDIHHRPECTCSFDGINPAVRAEECKKKWGEVYHRIIEITKAATGRHGDYDGRIGINMDFFDK